MPIPEKLRNYVESPHGMSMGTRDANMKPECHRVLGARAISEDKIQFFFDKKSARRTLDNIRENHNVTLVICSLTNFESYQFKGKDFEYRECNSEELQFFDNYMKGFNEAGILIGIKPGIAYNYPHSQMRRSGCGK